MPFWLWRIVFAGISFFITWITDPLNWSSCASGAKGNPLFCIGGMAAIFFGSYFIFTLIGKPKKKKD